MTVALRGGNEGRKNPRAVPDHLDIAKASRRQLCLGGFRVPITLEGGTNDIGEDDPLHPQRLRIDQLC